MNMRTLKIIGIVTMTLDHIGFYLLPVGTANLILRCIGRIAFPLFAFMIAEGFRHTHDLTRYWIRLLIASMVVEAAMGVYYLATGMNLMFSADIFLTLLFGLSGLILATWKGWAWKLLIPVIVAAAHFLGVSYGAFGVVAVLIFGWIPKRGWQVAAFALLLVAVNEFPIYDWFQVSTPFEDRIFGVWFQWFSLIAFVPLFLYNGERGRFGKWFFYLYYPAHLLVLLGIKTLLELI